MYTVRLVTGYTPAGSRSTSNVPGSQDYNFTDRRNVSDNLAGGKIKVTKGQICVKAVYIVTLSKNEVHVAK